MTENNKRITNPSCFCGEPGEVILEDDGFFYVVCSDDKCTKEAVWAETERDAIAAWKRSFAAPKGKRR